MRPEIGTGLEKCRLLAFPIQQLQVDAKGLPPAPEGEFNQGKVILALFSALLTLIPTYLYQNVV